MKEPTKKELRDHQDPLLLMTRYARKDVACMNRLVSVHDFKPKPKRKIQSGKGRDHKVLSAAYTLVSRKGEDQGKLRWGFTIEIKQGKELVVSFLELEIDGGADLACLSHDLREEEVWHFRAEIGDQPKLAKLLKGHGIKGKDKGVEITKPAHHLIVARDLISFFHDYCY
jgi:hypothetical protein